MTTHPSQPRLNPAGRSTGKGGSALTLPSPLGLAILVVVTGVILSLFSQWSIGWIPVFIGLLGWFLRSGKGRWAWALAILLSILRFWMIHDRNVEALLPDTLFAIVLIGFLAASFRYAELLRYRLAFQHLKQPVLPESASADSISPWNSLFAYRAYLGAVAVVGAGLLLILIPETNQIRINYWLQPRPGRLILLMFGMFFFWMLCRGILTLMARWQWTPQIAAIVFRCQYVDEMWPDLAGIEKRRSKSKYKIKPTGNQP